MSSSFPPMILIHPVLQVGRSATPSGSSFPLLEAKGRAKEVEKQVAFSLDERTREWGDAASDCHSAFLSVQRAKSRLALTEAEQRVYSTFAL